MTVYSHLLPIVTVLCVYVRVWLRAERGVGCDGCLSVGLSLCVCVVRYICVCVCVTADTFQGGGHRCCVPPPAWPTVQTCIEKSDARDISENYTG